MSIPVDIADLARALDAFGSGYLVTAGADGRVKVVTVDPRLEGELVHIDGPSRGSAANLATTPAATLVFAPTEPRGHTLLVDGTARAAGDGFRFTPVSAVLHRPGSHADGPPPPAFADDATDCENDCRPV